MDLALAALAEQLAVEYEDVPIGIVVRILTDCVDELPSNDSHFIEQAAKARLSLLGRLEPA